MAAQQRGSRAGRCLSRRSACNRGGAVRAVSRRGAPRSRAPRGVPRQRRLAEEGAVFARALSAVHLYRHEMQNQRAPPLPARVRLPSCRRTNWKRYGSGGWRSCRSNTGFARGSAASIHCQPAHRRCGAELRRARQGKMPASQEEMQEAESRKQCAPIAHTLTVLDAACAAALTCLHAACLLLPRRAGRRRSSAPRCWPLCYSLRRASDVRPSPTRCR